MQNVTIGSTRVDDCCTIYPWGYSECVELVSEQADFFCKNWKYGISLQNSLCCIVLTCLLMEEGLTVDWVLLVRGDVFLNYIQIRTDCVSDELVSKFWCIRRAAISDVRNSMYSKEGDILITCGDVGVNLIYSRCIGIIIGERAGTFCTFDC